MIPFFLISEKKKQEKMTNFNQNHPLFQEKSVNPTDFIQFEQYINQLAQVMGLSLKEYEIDHIAVRVNQCKEAEEWLTVLLKYGTILSDNIVNGRVIYLIRLLEPLILANQQINIIELPFPKDKNYPQNSWEHIEVVLPFLENERVSEWVERVENLFLWNKFSDLAVKVSEPKVEGEQLPNPSIAVSFRDKTINNTCIKVHPYHITKIIEV